MRTCTKCKRANPNCGFSPDKRASDGLQSQCRECCNSPENRKKKAAQIRRRRVMRGDEVRARDRAYGSANAEKILQYRHDRRKADPRVSVAHSRLNKAILRGEIVRLPCAVCGATKTEGHHENYDKPFDVTFLCRRHHVEVHRELCKRANPVR